MTKLVVPKSTEPKWKLPVPPHSAPVPTTVTERLLPVGGALAIVIVASIRDWFWLEVDQVEQKVEGLVA